MSAVYEAVCSVVFDASRAVHASCRHALKVVYLEHLGDVLKQREQSRRESGEAQQFLPAMRVFPRSTPHEQLKTQEKDTELLVRHLKVDENGFDVCHSEVNKVTPLLHQRPSAASARA